MSRTRLDFGHARGPISRSLEFGPGHPIVSEPSAPGGENPDRNPSPGRPPLADLRRKPLRRLRPEEFRRL